MVPDDLGAERLADERRSRRQVAGSAKAGLVLSVVGIVVAIANFVVAGVILADMGVI